MKKYIFGYNSFRADDVVEVLPFKEILITLDDKNCLDGMPFMPEMKQYCGKEFKIQKKANYICVDGHKPRGLRDTVFLEELRCDGSSHDNCKKTCLIFWKVTWLRKKSDTSKPFKTNEIENIRHEIQTKNVNNKAFFCQSSNLVEASFKLDIKSILNLLYKEIAYKNQSFFELIQNLLNGMVWKFLKKSMNSSCKRIIGDEKDVIYSSNELNLNPGELVQVKNCEEIKKTLDKNGKNRGLLFTPEMFVFCGKKFRVKKNLDKIIIEESGVMKNLSNTVILENVTCDGRCLIGCPRNMYHFWREAWLKRVN
ncbi:hypothetical protein ACFLSX_02500 [Calditrichota bacterium]